MNKGYKQAQRHWTHDHARACHLYLSLYQFSFVPQEKKVNLFCMGGISPADIIEKNNSSLWALREEILVEIMLLRERNSRCCKTCSCLSLGKVGRHGKGTSNFRKQIWSSFNNMHSFFWYQELLTTYLPFQEGTVFTGFWKNISE